MTDRSDKDWATKYLLDPLTAPEPRDETGPGTHFIRDFNYNNNNTNKHRQEKQASVSSYPTPPSSASPSRSTFSSNNPYNSVSPREQAFGGYDNRRARKGSLDGSGGSNNAGLSRSFSLNERPLDTIRKQSKAAHRSPHLRKKHTPPADTIDVLDRSFGVAYHHEGPYDATLLSRNLNPKSSPIEAVRGSNEEALRATPRENIRDALDRHMPLQGTAVIPPGEEDYSGRRMSYEEGADLMREPDAPGGAYKRWPDMKYHPDDLKGKGEPSYTVERALKKDDQPSHKRIVSDGNSVYEMQTPRPATFSRMGNSPSRRLRRLRSQSDNDAERAMNTDSRLKGMTARTSGIANGSGSGRENNDSETSGMKLAHGLKKRFGSLRIGRSTASKGTDV